MKYTAYTYLIRHIPSSKLYYGVRYAINRKTMIPENDLWVDYFTSSKIIHELVEQDGADAFEVAIDKIFDTAEEAIEYESTFLTENNVDSDEWLNGNVAGGIFPSEENFQKISDYHKGKPKSEEHKKKISEALTGNPKIANRHYSEEYKKNMSKIKSGEGNGMFNKKHTDETKKKMSESSKGIPAWNKGIPASDEQKAKQSAKMRGRKMDPAVVKRRAESQRGSKREKRQCPHCQQHIAVNAYPRWHGDNCKQA